MTPPLGNTSQQLRTVSNAAFHSTRPRHIPGLSSPPSSTSTTSSLSATKTDTTTSAKCQHRALTAPARTWTPISTTRTNTQILKPRNITAETHANMSTMKATGGHSQACCNIPPIVSDGYAKKGDYQTIDNRKTYVTGPTAEATRGILVIMDIFGFFDQTIQGCDILATADDHHKYAVFMPDAFDGEPLPIDLFPPDNEDKQKKVGEFFGKNSPPSFVPKALGVLKDAQAKYPNIKEWGVVGVRPGLFSAALLVRL